MRTRSVTIAKILQTKVSDVEHRFSPLYLASKYIGRSSVFVADKIRERKHIFQAANGNWWAITRINDQPVSLDKELEDFFASGENKNTLSVWDQTIHKNTPEYLAKKHDRRKRIKYLLLLIDAKYGGIEQAEDTPELLELRNLVNGY